MQVQPTTTSGPPSAGDIISWKQHRISWRQNWSDNWQILDYYECIELTESASPEIPSAKIRARNGTIKFEDQADFSDYDPDDLTDCFIKIEILPDPAPAGSGASPGNTQSQTPILTWYGFVPAEKYDVGAGDPSVTDTAFTVLGLEHLLDLVPITGSYVNDVHGHAQHIDTPMIFNERFVAGPHALGNCSNAQSSDVGGDYTAYVFDLTTVSPRVWCVADVVNYLLTWYGPQFTDITLGGESAALGALEEINLARLDLTNHTLLQALNKLLDARRGFGWSLTVDASENVEFTVFTLADVGIYAAGFTIPSNPNAQDLDITARIDIESAKIGTDASTKYGFIRVSGERILSTFSVSFAEGTLERCWTDDDETAYELAANKASADANAAFLNDLQRTADSLNHVWSNFFIPFEFEWKVGKGNGTTAAATQIANPDVADDGSIILDGSSPRAAPARNWGQRLERHLPFQKPRFADQFQPDFRDPLVLIQDPVTMQYVPVHRLGSAGEHSAHVRMLDNDFGFEVQANPPHLYAKNAFTDYKPTATAPIYDYTTIIATVSARTDRRLEVLVPIDTGDTSRELHIEIPDAELWYVAPNTILDLDSNAPDGFARQQAPFEIRNDKDRLQKVAAMAKAWYGTEHATLDMTVKRITADYPVGTFISTVTNVTTTQPINAPVTRRNFNLARNTSQILTGYAAPDFAELGL